MRRKAHSSRWYSWRGVERVDHGRTIRHGRIFELSYLHYILAFFHRALSIFRDHRLYPFCSQIVLGSLTEPLMILMSLIAQLKNIEKWCINLVRLHFYLLTVLLLKWLQPERISPCICLPWKNTSEHYLKHCIYFILGNTSKRLWKFSEARSVHQSSLRWVQRLWRP